MSQVNSLFIIVIGLLVLYLGVTGRYKCLTGLIECISSGECKCNEKENSAIVKALESVKPLGALKPASPLTK